MAFHRLMVPLDGSTQSEAALPAARRLAERLRASVVLLHVIEEDAPEWLHGERHLREAGAAEAYLRTVAASFPEGVPVESHVHAVRGEGAAVGRNEVAGSIAGHAGEWNADLVLMSTHGRRGVRQLFKGTVAQQVVRRGVPVLLVRPGGAKESEAWEEVLVPLEDAALGMQVMPFWKQALALVRSGGGAVRLLTVVPTLETLSGPESSSRVLLPSTTAEVLALEEGDAARALEVAVRRLGEAGIPASGTVRRGDAAEEILAELERRKERRPLLVLGTRGKAGLEAFWLGSVAARVLPRLTGPVLLMPTPQRAS